MKISALSLPKDRSLRVPSDDTLLVLPGVLGVFDGATSPQKHSPTGASSGRIASQAAAIAVACLAQEGELPTAAPARIFAEISERIREASHRRGMEGKPSTTMALAVRCDDHIRFLLVGDSGIRINASRLIRCEKPIDSVSTQARLAVYATLAGRQDDADEIERLARSVSFEGFDRAVETGLLAANEAARIQADVASRFAEIAPEEDVRRFLANGIRQQYRFANNAAHPMGYSTLNGDETCLKDIIDVRLPLAEVGSIEIFTDGYFLIPESASIDAWEEAFVVSEAEDFAKLGRFASVKGSTSREFADDRAVIVADMVNGVGASGQP